MFFARDNAPVVLSKFAAPDLAVFSVGSIIAGFLAWWGGKTATYAAWFVVGAATYACVGAIAVNWPLLSVPLADGLMLGTIFTSVYCAVRLTRRYG
jgi:hypothetical protein